jgi:hypothetical protein
MRRARVRASTAARSLSNRTPTRYVYWIAPSRVCFALARTHTPPAKMGRAYRPKELNVRIVVLGSCGSQAPDAQKASDVKITNGCARNNLDQVCHARAPIEASSRGSGRRGVAAALTNWDSRPVPMGQGRRSKVSEMGRSQKRSHCKHSSA